MMVSPINVILGVALMAQCLVIAVPTWEWTEPGNKFEWVNDGASQHEKDLFSLYYEHRNFPPMPQEHIISTPPYEESNSPSNDDISSSSSSTHQDTDWRRQSLQPASYADRNHQPVQQASHETEDQVAVSATSGDQVPGTPATYKQTDWEPSSFALFPSVPPLPKPRRASYIGKYKDIGALDQVNRLMGNTIHWAPEKEMDELFDSVTKGHTSPYKRDSRVLPLYHSSSPENIRFHLTSHPAVLQNAMKFRGRTLRGHDYYALWGNPEEPEQPGRMYLYGAGYIEEKDFDEVDRNVIRTLHELSHSAHVR